MRYSSRRVWKRRSTSIVSRLTTPIHTSYTSRSGSTRRSGAWRQFRSVSRLRSAKLPGRPTRPGKSRFCLKSHPEHGGTSPTIQARKPPPVKFDDAAGESTSAEPGAYRFKRGPVFGEREGRRTRQHGSAERKLRAIVQVLAAYGILESLTDQQQERLLAGMRQILEASDQ